MSRRRIKKPTEPESPQPMTVETDGRIFEAMRVAGEAWIAPEEYLRALETIDQQAAEMERLRAAHPNGKAQDKPTVKKHLRCPLCFNGRGGKAARRKWQRQVNGPLQQRCYVCNVCGAEWVVEVRAEESDGILKRTTRVAEVRSA